ncbi:hypothetical protein K440DRAFT_615309 [Wilcoxina mikolae CBS 423.85]|nr:hypothetical protein K440DRAFT_615309 [Wilcoxina mikolae CBS 423.85]
MADGYQWTVCEYCGQTIPPGHRVAHIVQEHQRMLCVKPQHRRPDTVNEFGHARVIREAQSNFYILACGCVKRKPDGVFLFVRGT